MIKKGAAALKKIKYPIFGAAFALPIIFTGLGIFQWILMIPVGMLCLSEKKTEGKRAFLREYLRGFAFFYGFYVVCYSWFVSMYPLSVTGLPKMAALFIVLLAWLGIPLLQAVGFGIIFPIFRLAAGRIAKGLLPIFMGALWCVGEWLQSFFWFGIPFVKLALGQTENPLFFASADLFGTYFVDFLIVTVNFYIALAIKEGAGRKRSVFAFSAALIFLCNCLYGALDSYAFSLKKGDFIRVSVFQGNVSTAEKWSGHMTERSFEIYESFARRASEEGAEYAILPETVFPYVIDSNPEIDSRLRDMAWGYDLTLMVGTFGKGEGGNYNVIRVYEPMKEGVTVYAKQRPVPFGEYMPMRDFLTVIVPALGEINMLSRNIISGEGSDVWESEDGSFGYLICFDSIYPQYARKSVSNGAKVLFISTNDSWFENSAGIRMHNAHAKLRASENGRTVLRAANTGISSVIDGQGNVIDTIEWNQREQMTHNITLNSDTTLYTAVGELFVYLSAAFCILCLLLAEKERRNNRCEKTENKE